MHWRVDYQSGVPLYLQLLEQVKAAVASGVLRSGDQLPSVRALAESLRVNRNTIAKAYSEMEREGLVDNRQGSGSFVSASPTPLRKAVRTERLSELVDSLIVQAHHLQIGGDALRSLVDERLEHFETTQAHSNAPRNSP